MFENNIKVADDNIIQEACCGFVVSSYPNPKVANKDCVPNFQNKVFDILKNKLIFISHRFNKDSDYPNVFFNINKENSICLSPIAKRIGLDYFHPIEMPIEPKLVSLNKPIKFTAQAHFEFHNRDYKAFLKFLTIIRSRNTKLNLLGTKSKKYFSSAFTSPR